MTHSNLPKDVVVVELSPELQKSLEEVRENERWLKARQRWIDSGRDEQAFFELAYEERSRLVEAER